MTKRVLWHFDLIVEMAETVRSVLWNTDDIELRLFSMTWFGNSISKLTGGWTFEVERLEMRESECSNSQYCLGFNSFFCYEVQPHQKQAIPAFYGKSLAIPALERRKCSLYQTLS